VDWGDEHLAAGNGTGIRYEHPTVEGLRWAMGRAIDLFRSDRAGWNTAVSRVMQLDWSWGEPARKYISLYTELMSGSAL
jgi:glycogen synthase